MGEDIVELSLDGRPVAEYVVDPALDVTLGPRPYLHPVHTLSGTVVTDAQPADHAWHLGAGLAVQDVSGSNLWGGRTYVRDVGYTWRHDHGRIVHEGWLSRSDDRLAHRLSWCDPNGDLLLTEEREVMACRITPPTTNPPPVGRSLESTPPVGDGGERGGTGAGPGGVWALEVGYTLTAPADRNVTLGSPATNGRPGGAGYGGFFWRVAPAAEAPNVFTERENGEDEVNGSTQEWVALVRPAYTLVFCGLGAGTHWFVRTTMYPGVCAAFAFDTVRVIEAGTSVIGRHRVLVADGRLDRPAVRALVGRPTFR